MYRKISKYIEKQLKCEDKKILCIEGARQVGKSYVIREVGHKMFAHYVEINLADDILGNRYFADVSTLDDFKLTLSAYYGDKLGKRNDTLVFLDEIQIYPRLFSLMKAIALDDQYKYICSGSELGIAMKSDHLSPMGYVSIKRMYPMDFEEFLYATNSNFDFVESLRKCFIDKKELLPSIHDGLIKLFKTYLYVGGMPEAVKSYVETKNVHMIRELQSEIVSYYKEGASKYDTNNKLKIKRIYEMIPSNLENKVKRIQFKGIEDIDDARFDRYKDEFDYLIHSGIALDVRAISEPRFPLIQSSQKNLIKLYMNDVGLLTNILYKNNINALLGDEGVNLGMVYESVAAQELIAHGHNLFYYDRKKIGEIDFLVDDYDDLSVLPIEIKSGKNTKSFKALPKLMETPNYQIKRGYVFSNDREVVENGNIISLPIYYLMFI